MLRLVARGAVERRDRRAAACSPRRRSRRTCPRCCASSACATACRPSSSPTTSVSCARAHPEDGGARPLLAPDVRGASAAPMLARVIEVEQLSKRFGATTAVDRLSFEIRPGRVTGFLGPNGAGKTHHAADDPRAGRPDARHATSPAALRDWRPAHGRRRARGRRLPPRPQRRATTCASWPSPAAHPPRARRRGARRGRPDRGRRPARRRLLARACASGSRSPRRCSATPQVLILDEPANGLDPPGIRWLRDLLRAQAARGRTVLVSSHVLAEVALTADDVVVIADGGCAPPGRVEQVLGTRGELAAVSRVARGRVPGSRR